MALLHRMSFRGRRASLDAAPAAIETDSVNSRVVIDHRCVVNVAHHGGVDVGHASVIEILPTSPVTAIKAGACIAEAIVNSAIKTNHWSPISGVPQIEPVGKTPVARCPQQSGLRWQDPCAGHPIIPIVIVIRPITRHPNIARAGAYRLSVDRQDRRADSHRHGKADLRSRSCIGQVGSRDEGCQQQYRTKHRRQPHNHPTFLAAAGPVPCELCCQLKPTLL